MSYASNLGLKDRGLLKAGMAADIVLFDPATIADHSTFARPMQFSTGVRDVFVNGVQVLKDGKPTGEKPGRFIKGAGWIGWPGGGACRLKERQNGAHWVDGDLKGSAAGLTNRLAFALRRWPIGPCFRPPNGATSVVESLT